jgi:virulence-associated protein VagC
MKKIWLFIATWGLVTTAVNISNYASANAGDSNSPHIDSKFEFPNTKWMPGRQTIQVHVPQSSQALTRLWIDVPQDFEFQTSKVEITDGNRIIFAPISRQGKWLLINFRQPLAPNTKLRIELNHVKRNFLTQLPVYYLYDEVVDGSTNFIGEAYFPAR